MSGFPRRRPSAPTPADDRRLRNNIPPPPADSVAYRPALARFLAVLLAAGSSANASLIALSGGTEPSSASAPIQLAAFVVDSGRTRLDDVPVTQSVTLTGGDLAARPQVGGDLLRGLTLLSGVTADDFTARFRVRGAPNHQVLARLDGVDLLEPYHLKDIDGALSIIDQASINRVNLSSGGFSAEHGDRLAGVLTMETPSGADLRPHLALDASLLSFRVGGSGAFAAGRGRWLASGRRGYPELALQGRADEMSPEYYDLSGKIEYQLTERHALSLHGLHAVDTMEAQFAHQPPLSSRYGSNYLWARWRGEFSERLTGESVASVQWLTWHRAAEGMFGPHRHVSMRDDRRFEGVGLRNDWTLGLSDYALVRTGWEAKLAHAHYDYELHRERLNIPGSERSWTRSVRQPWGTSLGLYATPRVQWGRHVTIEPGVRLDHRSHISTTDWSPRLNASLAVGRTTVRASWGQYNQAQGLHELAVADGDASFYETEQAESRALGVEHIVRPGIVARVDVYQRLSWDLRPYWENLLQPAGAFPELMSDRRRFDPSRGRAEGVELALQGSHRGRWTWGAGYTLARAEEEIAGTWIPSARDERHAFQGHLSYSPNPRWQFSTAWRYHTGWPITRAHYSAGASSDGALLWTRTVGPVNGERLPDYHRLDL